VEDAKATMGIFRLHKNVWERASGTISLIRDPEPMDLSDLDGELNSTIKRRKLAELFGIGGYSSVCLFPFSSYMNYFINRNSLKPQIYTVWIKMVGKEQVGRSRRREDLRRRV
jgi:hypothetical protein